MFKHSGLETDMDNFKAAKMHLQRMILTKKKSYFEEELAKHRNKHKEVWKSLKSLGITQPAFTCSKLTIETLEQGVKYVQS